MFNWKLFSLPLILLFSYCNSGNEELAVFDGGKVLRKELREFYAMRDVPLNENTTSVKTQSAILENISIQTIVSIESQKKNVQDSSIFKKALELSEVQLTANIYMKNFLEKVKKDNKVELVTVQFAIYSAENPKAQTALADLNALKGDDKINAYIAETTEEGQRKPIAGYFEPQCINCVDEVYLENVFKEGVDANDSQFHQKEFQGKVFVYRVIERKKVSYDDLENYYKKIFSQFKDMAIEYKNTHQSEADKKLAEYYSQEEPELSRKVKLFSERVGKNFEQFHWKKEFQRLQDEKDYKISKDYLGLIQSGANTPIKDETVVIESKTNPITYAMLNAEFKSIEELRGKDAPNSDRDKMDFLQNFLFPKVLIANSEEGKKVKESEKYAIHLEFLKRNIFWNLYIKDLQESIPKPTEQQIRETYEAGKMFAYAEETNDPKVKKPMPFEKVKDRISSEIQESKTKSAVEKRIEELKSNYKLQFFIEKLKPGSI
jgi:hypothetical protein